MDVHVHLGCGAHKAYEQAALPESIRVRIIRKLVQVMYIWVFPRGGICGVLLFTSGYSVSDTQGLAQLLHYNGALIYFEALSS